MVQNHLLFPSRASADTAANILAMSIIFNVTPLWKVLTGKPHRVQEQSSWKTQGQRGKVNPRVSFQRVVDHRRRSQPYSYCALSYNGKITEVETD